MNLFSQKQNRLLCKNLSSVPLFLKCSFKLTTVLLFFVSVYLQKSVLQMLIQSKKKYCSDHSVLVPFHKMMALVIDINSDTLTTK